MIFNVIIWTLKHNYRLILQYLYFNEEKLCFEILDMEKILIGLKIVTVAKNFSTLHLSGREKLIDVQND